MKIPVLMYHEIDIDLRTAQAKRDIHPSYMVPLESFNNQLELIAASSISSLTIGEISESARKSDAAVALTFDDGYLGNYSLAFPSLAQRQMKATFFCAVSLIGRPYMMDWTHLREMAAAGMSIQSHGLSHKPLASLAKKELDRELRQSKSELEQNLGQEVACVSLPHGSYNRAVVKAAADMGYRSICTSVPGYNRGHEFLLRRVNVRSEFDLEKFRSIVSGKQSFVLSNMVLMLKSLVKNMIGHETYLRIYHRVHGIK
jgi:peptidoglycan/xylan/chitin deacetylase (PgdA/CDA1 family)